MPEVVAANRLSGEPDFVAELVVADLAAYERLLTGQLLVLPMVKDIRSNFVLRAVKADGPLPIGGGNAARGITGRSPAVPSTLFRRPRLVRRSPHSRHKIGRAYAREKVCTYV